MIHELRSEGLSISEIGRRLGIYRYVRHYQGDHQKVDDSECQFQHYFAGSRHHITDILFYINYLRIIVTKRNQSPSLSN